MKYSESRADREIDKISDQYAFNRYTIKAAMDDDDMAYLFECFFKHEIDLDTGKPVTKHYLEKQLIQFNREISRRNCREPSCQTRHSIRSGLLRNLHRRTS
jgi:hypothetical protein